jgi:hypothetical protein
VTVSTPPPGGNGTIMRTGRDGHDCAEAGAQINDAMTAATAERASMHIPSITYLLLHRVRSVAR